MFRTIVCCLLLLPAATTATPYLNWNRYCIIITHTLPADTVNIAARLQLPEYAPAGTASFAEAVRSPDMFVAWQQGSMIIIGADVAYNMLSPRPSAQEERLTALFPNSQIITIIANSTTYYFGYALINDGRRLRLREGGDGDIFRATGAPLPEEDKTAATDLFTAEELKNMRANMMTDADIARLTNFDAAWHIHDLLAHRAFASGFDALEDAAYIRYVRK